MNAKDYFCREVITDYAKHDIDGYHLYVHQIPFDQLKLFMSHFLSAEEYEDACESITRTQEYINDWREEMQDYIDIYLADKQQTYMEEHGLYWFRHSDGDRTCARR